jgi:two-component system response regulator
MLEEQNKILLVEDNEEDVELTLHALRHECIINKIQVARDGEEALDLLFGTGSHAGQTPYELPRLILLDLKLPKVNGIEVLKKIKSDERTKATPVVILTSSKEDRDLVESYGSGANSYIQKPVDFEQFRSVVRQAGLYWLLINQSPLPARAA